MVAQRAYQRSWIANGTLEAFTTMHLVVVCGRLACLRRMGESADVTLALILL